MTAASAGLSEIPFSSMLPINDEFETVCMQFESNMKGTACICEIYKTENHYLVENYELCKKSICEKRKKEPEEIIVYHGTTYAAACNIMTSSK
jgi:hypothetical protein